MTDWARQNPSSTWRKQTQYEGCCLFFEFFFFQILRFNAMYRPHMIPNDSVSEISFDFDSPSRPYPRARDVVIALSIFFFFVLICCTQMIHIQLYDIPIPFSFDLSSWRTAVFLSTETTIAFPSYPRPTKCSTMSRAIAFRRSSRVTS